MCFLSQLVVNPILIYCRRLDSVEHHKINMIYIKVITPTYE